MEVFFFSSRRRHTSLSGDWSSECALPIWAAYALATYLNRRGGMPSMPRSLRTQTPQRLPGRVTEEREVQALVNWLLTQAFEQTGVRVADDKMAYQRIVESA